MLLVDCAHTLSLFCYEMFNSHLLIFVLSQSEQGEADYSAFSFSLSCSDAYL